MNINTALSQLEVIVEINGEPVLSLPGVKLEGTLNLETHWDDQKQIEGVRIMGAQGGLTEEFNQTLQLGGFTIDATVTDDTTLTIFSGLDVAQVDDSGSFSLDSHVAQLIDGQIAVSDLGTIPGFADINVNMGVLKPTLPVPAGLFGQLTLDELSSSERWATVTAPLRVGLGARTIAPNLRLNLILAGNIVAEGTVAVPELSSATLIATIASTLAFAKLRRRAKKRSMAKLIPAERESSRRSLAT